MFVVLRYVEPEKKRLARKRQKKLLERSAPAACPTLNGLPFYTLDVLNDKGGINWDSVCKKCGRYASRIVAPRCLCLPDSGILKRFLPSFSAAHFIFNTALETIKAMTVPPDRFSVTVTDRTAAVSSKICSLLPYSSVVRVITANPERYSSACAEAFDRFGASLIIRSSYEPLRKPDVVICCDGCATSAMTGAAVFSAKHGSFGALRFCGSGMELSERYREIIPPDIEAVDFCSAVTELCGSSEYRNSSFSEIETSCRECAHLSPDKCLECYCCGAYLERALRK